MFQYSYAKHRSDWFELLYMNYTIYEKLKKLYYILYMKLLATKKKLSVHRSSDIYKIPIITRSMEYFKEFIAFEDPNLTNVLES